MFPETLHANAEKLLAAARAEGVRLAVAESCTGGLISALLTEIPGSSDVFDRGFVTYSNEAKCAQLGVAKTLIEAHGAVSEETARAMAAGALAHSLAGISVAITGIAGPGGGSAEKPVGLVWIAAADESNIHARSFHFEGTREEVRLQAVEEAVNMLIDAVTSASA